MDRRQTANRGQKNSEENKEDNAPLLLTSSGLIYQPIQLNKQMTKRSQGEEQIEALERATGLSTINPDTDFKPSFLRDMIKKPNSETCEFLIVVTMYNESSDHFNNTISGIIENLKIFERKGISHEKIACVVIVDGMKAFLETNKGNLDYFSQFFNENSVKDWFQVDDLMNCKLENEKESDEFAYCFMLEFSSSKSDIPLKMVFCVKQKNKRKLNTHLWFFGGFCEMIQPKFVMLLDVGTKPEPCSLFYLYEALHCYPDLAGFCGEINP